MDVDVPFQNENGTSGVTMNIVLDNHGVFMGDDNRCISCNTDVWNCCSCSEDDDAGGGMLEKGGTIMTIASECGTIPVASGTIWIISKLGE